MGALRRPHPGPHPHRRSHSRRQRQRNPAAAGLCTWRGNFAGSGAADRGPPLCNHETISGRRRMDTARARRGCAGGRRGHRARTGHRISYTPFHHQHQRPRTDAAAEGRTGAEDNIHRRGGQHTAGGRKPAGTDRRYPVAEFAAADPRAIARQGGAGGFLDLLLHQLSSRTSLRESLGTEIYGAWPGGDRHARARIRL